jgi:hypothetical protein
MKYCLIKTISVVLTDTLPNHMFVTQQDAHYENSMGGM